MTTKAVSRPRIMQALHAAIDKDAFEYLSTMAPEYLDAIEEEIAGGATPEEIGREMRKNVGPDRVGMALRCEQAARYVVREMGK